MKCCSPYQRIDRLGHAHEHGCGRCLPCRINRAEEWSTRLLLELENPKTQGDFVTLTFDDEKSCPLLPMALSKRVLQNFWKRIRKTGVKLSYFACGEYGEKHQRAHFHAVVLRPREWQPNYQKHWPWGGVHIGTVTKASARYVTGYLTKSNAIPPGKAQWPPFQTQSQGLGKSWAIANRYDLYKELSWVPKYLASYSSLQPPRNLPTRDFTSVSRLDQRLRNAHGRTRSRES